jgi:hypothetical protein
MENMQMKVEWKFNYEDIETGEKWVDGPYKNKIVQGGLNNIAQLLIGEVSSSTAASHIVWGSNTAAATITDTIATMTEVGRQATTTKSRSNETAYLRTFLGSSTGNGNHKEIGLVARGTTASGSGVLLTRLVQSFSKTATQVLTIEVRWVSSEV